MDPGDVLDDRFVVEEAISRGGAGVVFRGWDLRDEAPVAIKVLAELGASDVQRFRREAALLAELELPGIVGYVHDGATPDGVPYLVMEWLAGETVAARMDRDGYDLCAAVAVVGEIARAIDPLHRRGLVHRDLKPENVILVADAPLAVKVIDLGLTRAARRADVRVTATGVILGTPGYMAPEQVRGEPVIDPRADVFALGCVLFECATGYPAFAGENYLAVRSKILLSAPPRLRALCPEAPAALDDLVARLLAKDPRDRPATGGAVAALLATVGALPPGPTRCWHAARSQTLAPAPTLTGEAWAGVVLAQTSALADAALARDVAIEGGRLDAIEGDYLVISIAEARSPDALARALARSALAVARYRPDAPVVVSSGANAIGELIDDAARCLERSERAALLAGARTDSDPAIYIDARLARLLAPEFAVEERAGGWQLLAARRVR